MSWTDERVETLKKMWGEGQSASQIAKELGGVTRNAVIGKVHRLGLSNRAGTGASQAKTEANKEAKKIQNIVPCLSLLPSTTRRKQPLAAVNRITTATSLTLRQAAAKEASFFHLWSKESRPASRRMTTGQVRRRLP